MIWSSLKEFIVNLGTGDKLAAVDVGGAIVNYAGVESRLVSVLSPIVAGISYELRMTEFNMPVYPVELIVDFGANPVAGSMTIEIKDEVNATFITLGVDFTTLSSDYLNLFMVKMPQKVMPINYRMVFTSTAALNYIEVSFRPVILQRKVTITPIV